MSATTPEQKRILNDLRVQALEAARLHAQARAALNYAHTQDEIATAKYFGACEVLDLEISQEFLDDMSAAGREPL